MNYNEEFDRIIKLVKENNQKNNVEIISALLALKLKFEKLTKVDNTNLYNVIQKIDTSNMSTEEYIKLLKIDKYIYEDMTALFLIEENFKTAKQDYINDGSSVLEHPKINESIDVLNLPEKIYHFLISYNVNYIVDVFVYGEYLKYDRLLSEQDYNLIVQAIEILGIDTSELVSHEATRKKMLENIIRGL